MMEAPQTPQPSELDPQARVVEAEHSDLSATSLSASQIVERIAVLLVGETLPERKTIDTLSYVFEQRKAEALRTGDTQLQEQIDLQQERLGDLLRQFRELDAKRREELIAKQTANRDAAKEVMTQIAALLESTEEFGHIYTVFHELRQRWEGLRPLDPQDERLLRREFVELRDRFYELKNINEELRELDYRVNLKAKQELIEELRTVATLEDIIQAKKQADTIAIRWRDMGPVAPAERNAINAAYKELSQGIFRRHQAFIDERRQAEQSSHSSKQTLLERLEAMLVTLPTKRRDWEAMTEQVKAIQTEWRTLGYSGKGSDTLYQRLRAGMDAFYHAKGEFFSRLSGELEANLSAKRVLVERARELRDSTDWSATAKELKELQVKWAGIGNVPERYRQRIWEEFRGHMDHFFEQRKQHDGSRRSGERQNLQLKRAILDELKALEGETEEVQDLTGKLRALSDRWQAIGHVPYSEKETLHQEYRRLLDALYGRVRDNRSRRRIDSYSTSIEQLSGDKQALREERQRMERQRQRLQAELRTYENNMNFLNLSKGASALLRDVERKHDSLSEELRLIEEKINLLDKQA